MKIPFDIEKFMTFKVNTYAFKNEFGGCIKCCVANAFGKDLDAMVEVFYPPNQISIQAHTAYPSRLPAVEGCMVKPNWALKEYGFAFAKLLDEAEEELREMLLSNFSKMEGECLISLLGCNLLKPQQEAELKKFVLDGMAELGLIEREELCLLC